GSEGGSRSHRAGWFTAIGAVLAALGLSVILLSMRTRGAQDTAPSREPVATASAAGPSPVQAVEVSSGVDASTAGREADDGGAHAGSASAASPNTPAPP